MDSRRQRLLHDIAKVDEYLNRSPKCFKLMKSLNESIIHKMGLLETDAEKLQGGLSDLDRSILNLARSSTRKLVVKIRQQPQNNVESSAVTLSASATRAGTLSPVQIPKFSGEPIEWSSFISIFTATVDENPNLTDEIKMLYLKEHLDGEPLEIVSEMPISAKNYSAALELLKELYFRNNFVFIQTLYDRLEALPAVATDAVANLPELRVTYGKAEAILRSMEHYGVDVSGSLMLTSSYLKKFPENWYMSMNRVFAEGFCDFRQKVPGIIDMSEMASTSFDFYYERVRNSSSTGVGHGYLAPDAQSVYRQ